MNRNRMPRIGHAAIVSMLAITFTLGCNDDGTPSVTVSEENIEAVALSGADAAVRAARVPFLLENLGYIILDSPLTALASGPSAGIVEDPVCEGGLHSIEEDEATGRMTVLFTQCGIGFFECYVDGYLQITPTTLGEGEAQVDATEYSATDLTVDCGLGTPLLTIDGDRITCPDDADYYDECVIELASFDGAHSERGMRLSNVEITRGVEGGPSDVTGTAVDSTHGRFDFESTSVLEFDCDLMPSEGMIMFSGAPPTVGTIEFDDECVFYEVCLWADEAALELEPESCDMVLYPGVVPL